MIEEACTCGGLPAHSHVYRPVAVRIGDVNVERREPDEYDVRMWVDWRALARELTVAGQPGESEADDAGLVGRPVEGGRSASSPRSRRARSAG